MRRKLKAGKLSKIDDQETALRSIYTSATIEYDLFTRQRGKGDETATLCGGMSIQLLTHCDMPKPLQVVTQVAKRTY